jgi:hypothetical protein
MQMTFRGDVGCPNAAGPLGIMKLGGSLPLTRHEGPRRGQSCAPRGLRFVKKFEQATKITCLLHVCTVVVVEAFLQ